MTPDQLASGESVFVDAVSNFDYVDGTVPELDNLASQLFLCFPEDVEEVVEKLEASYRGAGD